MAHQNGDNADLELFIITKCIDNMINRDEQSNSLLKHITSWPVVDNVMQFWSYKYFQAFKYRDRISDLIDKYIEVWKMTVEYSWISPVGSNSLE